MPDAGASQPLSAARATPPGSPELYRREEEPRRRQCAASSPPQSRPAWPGSPNSSCSCTKVCCALKGTQATVFTVCHSRSPLQWASGNQDSEPAPPPNSTRDAQVVPTAVACWKAKETQHSADGLPSIEREKNFFLRKSFLFFCPQLVLQ